MSRRFVSPPDPEKLQIMLHILTVLFGKVNILNDIQVDLYDIYNIHRISIFPAVLYFISHEKTFLKRVECWTDTLTPHSTLPRTGALSRRAGWRGAQPSGSCRRTVHGWGGSSQGGCEAARQTFTPRGDSEAPSCRLRLPRPYPEPPWPRGPPREGENLGCPLRRLGCAWQRRREAWSTRPPPRTAGTPAGRLTGTVCGWQAPGGRRPARRGTALPAGHMRPNPTQGSGPRTCREKL